MEQENKTEFEQESGCKNCGSSNIEEGFAIPLCTECRDIISKRKFPIWIKVFLICLAIVFTISLLNFPKALNAGVAYEKGLRYEQQHRYASAAKEFEKTTAVYPDSTEALCKLFISYYYNDEIEKAASTFKIVAGREFDNDKLIDEVNEIISKLDELYIPTEAFAKLQEETAKDSMDVYLGKLLEYSKANEMNTYEKYILANAYYDNKDFEACKVITEQIVGEHPDFFAGDLLLAAVARETANYNKGIEYCNQILAYNVESYEALAARSRIELRRSNDAAGLKDAKQAFELQPNDPYVVSTLALAYHFNNMVEDRDKLVQRFESGDLKGSYYYEMLKSVIDGTESWRS